MKTIKSYQQFIKSVSESFGEEKDIFYSFIESFYLSDLLTNEEKSQLEIEIHSPIQYVINENFFDKLKSRYDKAKQVSKELSDKAKVALEKLVDAAKHATDFVVKIKEFLTNQITSILTQGKDKLKSKFKSDQRLVSKIREVSSKDKNQFLKDLDLCKQVAKFYTTLFKDKFISLVTSAMTKFLSSEDKEVAVSEKVQYITESNMIGKLIDGISHIPPFSWLHQVQHMGEKGAQNIIKGLSFVTQKMGGPEIILPVIAAILGIAFEYNVKGLVKTGLLDMVETYAIPFIGIVIKFIGFVATIIAVVDLIDELTGTKEKGIEDVSLLKVDSY